MATSQYTQLPASVGANLTDITCVVQGYVSPTSPGISVQQTLQQIYDLFAEHANVFSWVNISSAPTSPLTSNRGYFISFVGSAGLTLPTVSAFGDIIYILGRGGSWTLSQGAGQQVIIGADSTTIGIGGRLSSTNNNDSIQLVCTQANLTWQAPNGPQGNITIV
jgi:hypothetical protein